jgi:signal transduction histidine kinase
MRAVWFIIYTLLADIFIVQKPDLTPNPHPLENSNKDISDAIRRADILQRVMATISSGLELDPLLSNILESAVTLIEATHGTIGLVVDRNGKLVIRTVAVHNMPDAELGAEMPPGMGLAGKVLLTKQTIRLDRYGDLERPTLQDLSEHSVIGVPILWGERMIGFFGIGIEAPRRFSDHDVETLEFFAQYAAVAIHNANLFKANQHALDEMHLLYKTSQRIGLSDDVDGVIDAYLDQVAADGEYICNICLYEFDEFQQRTAVLIKGRWTPDDGSSRMEERVPYVQDNLDAILDSGETIVISDVRNDPRAPESLKEIQEESGRWALVMIPLMVRSQRIGLVILSHQGVHEWAEDTLSPYRAVAAQLAIALDHRMQQTLLQERGQQLAVLKERHRLARELHDSVTQLIFSTTLIAQSITPAWRRDPLEGERRVERLLELSQTALREMRSLLFELKSSEEMQDRELPATLTGLERIRHYGVLGAVRLLAGDVYENGIIVNVEADEAGSIYLGPNTSSRIGKEPVLEEGIYRIIQESLNNAVKHSRARHISINILCNKPGVLYFSVTDDGAGLPHLPTSADEKSEGSGLGMKTMRERAEAMGGVLRIMSAPGKGTTIEVTVPLKENRV